MATIALYSNKINQMPSLISDVKKSVADFKSDLFSFKTKASEINKSVCDLDDVISSIQASTETQEDKITSLESLQKNTEKFIDDTNSIDSDVADVIKSRKDDFYEKYNYLKPDCEKSWLEQRWEDCKSALKTAGEWCKEHWVMIVTVLVVIAIAIIAVATFGVAIAAIAAIAGIISLVLCIADVICMIATGGKSISDVCRENGMGWLGEIFDGVSIGCDIVSIAFPAGAAIKTMAKVGVKSFAKASIRAMKLAFTETVEKVFKSGFKQGIKNFGKITFKTFIFDIDDFSRINSSGKRAFDIFDHTPTTKIPKDIPLNSGGLNPDGTFSGKWPDKDGFLGDVAPTTLEPGSRIDRFSKLDENGKDLGYFTAPEGTPYKNRALRPGTNAFDYNSYDVIEPIEVLGGTTASWFNEPGGGLQFKFSDSVQNLLDSGKLRIRNYSEIVGKGFSQFALRHEIDAVTTDSY